MSYYYGLQTVTAPTELALTDDELVRSARLITGDAQLDELKAKAWFATEMIEEKTKRVAMETQYRMSLSRFPALRGQAIGRLMIANGIVRLPRAPVISVDSITYVDVDGVERTLDPSSYQVRTNIEPAIVSPARLAFWPITDPWTLGGVEITFTAGYESRADVPHKLKEAIKFLANYRFFNRESDDGGIPESLNRLVNGNDIGWLD